MKISLDNARCKVTEASEYERKWLYTYLQFSDMSRFWGAKMAGVKASSKAKLYDKRNNTFPSGLLAKVTRAAAAEHAAALEDGLAEDDPTIITPVELSDVREPPCAWDFDADLEWLRNYQFDAVWYGAEATRGIIKMGTGAGKAEIMWGFVKALPCHWGILVHRKQLLLDLHKRWEEHTGIKAGIVGAGKGWNPDPNNRITFASLPTLARRLKKKDKDTLRFLGSLDGMLVDECHVLPAKSLRAVGLKAHNAYFRIGLSGTPLDRQDNRSVFGVAVLGELIVNIPAQTLIDAGWLAEPRITMIPLFQTTYFGLQSGGWQQSYKELIENSDERNALIADIVDVAAKPALVFVKGVDHGRYLSRVMQAIGISSEFVSGETPVASRQAAVKRLEYGDVDALIATSPVMQEGINIPSLASVVNAAGMASTIAALQRVGRGTRRTKEKSTFEVWDVLDEGDRYMEKHAKARVKAYEKEGYEVHIENRAEQWRAGERKYRQESFDFGAGLHRIDKAVRRKKRGA